MSACMMYETVWYDKRMYENAEIFYHEKVAQALHGADENPDNSPKCTVAAASSRPSELVHQVDATRATVASVPDTSDVPEVLKKYMNRVDTLETENKKLHDTVQTLQSSLKSLEDRLKKLEIGCAQSTTKSAPVAVKPAASNDDDDDDIDLFGSDDDDDEPVQAPQPKKSGKPALIAKSSIILEVKPWGDDTDMEELEKCVRSIACDGLLWGASKFVPVVREIRKLVIVAVVEDDKVGTDFLSEEILKFDQHVQSMDIVAFNKV